MDWFISKYLPDPARRAEPQASPLRAPRLAGLPPAYVATCIPDVLRDEGEAYAARLREAGVAVATQRHDQIHGFFNTTAARSSRHGLRADRRRAAPGPGVNVLRRESAPARHPLPVP